MPTRLGPNWAIGSNLKAEFTAEGRYNAVDVDEAPCRARESLRLDGTVDRAALMQLALD
jgi:hypothetical protein